MSGDQAVLRTTLLEGLVEAARVNVDAGNERDRALRARARLPPVRGAAARGALARRRDRRGRVRRGAGARRGALRGVTAARARAGRAATVLHPGKAAETEAGWLGELHPALLEGAWGVFELDVDALMAPIPERILYDDVITYPANRQDIAVVVAEDVEAGALVAAAPRPAGRSCARRASSTSTAATRSGDGRKSVALHLVFQAPDRTLTDEDAARRGRGSSQRSPSASAPSCAR